MTVELHRPLALGQIPALGAHILVEATPSECSALALRMGLPEVLELRCRFDLMRETNTIVRATGLLSARVVQTCIVSLEDFEATVQEEFTARFVPSGTENDDPDPESEDEIPYEHGVLGLGEAAAEQLGLALDPYPRKDGAALPDIAEEDEPHPFAALDRLRRPH
ncbi:MAG: DUF177 domain-containing protein [Rhodospirillales bacterium]